MHRPGFIRTTGLAAVAVVVIGVIWYAAVQPEAGWPREARRVVHPNGFSVVAPSGWEKYVDIKTSPRTADVLRFLPAKAVGSPGFFAASRAATPETEQSLIDRGYRKITFLNQPAFEKIQPFKLTLETLRDVVFERDGVWYDVAVQRPNSEPVDGGVWRAYAESFRVEAIKKDVPVGVPLHLSTTIPTTAPATTAAP